MAILSYVVLYFSRELNTSHSSEDQHDWAADKPEGESHPTTTESADTKYVRHGFFFFIFFWVILLSGVLKFL